MYKVLKKIINFSKDQKKELTKGIIYGFICALFKTNLIVATVYVLQAIINNQASTKTIWIALGIMFVGIIGQIIFNIHSTMSLTIAGYTMAANSRISIADHLKNMSMGYFNKNNLGKITSVATNSAEQLNDNLTRCLMILAQGIFMSSIIAFSMFIIDWRMGLLCVLGIILYFIMGSYQQIRSKKVAAKLINQTQVLIDRVLEYIQGIMVVKSYNLLGSSNKRVENTIDGTKEIFFEVEKTFIPIVGMQALVFKSISFLMILFSVLYYIDGSMDLYSTIVINICSFLIFSDLEMASSFGSLLRIIEGSIQEIQEILNTKVMDESASGVSVEQFDINLNHISFSYDTKKIIDDIDLTIPQNSSLAIVGGSGSGKTTLCNLITRFWDVSDGEILLGGKNIKEFKTDELLSQFTMVFQNVYLFNDTIANNIKFGKQNASQEEIEAVCKKASCHDFIMNLENGYQTIIGEGGASLSGGEKQRISIARAMIKDAPIVILDEATANVDPENEHQLQKAITQLTKSKTVIMIAHRLKTVKNADHIIVLENGKIIESGKHDDLLKNGKTYSNFVEMKEKASGWKIASK